MTQNKGAKLFFVITAVLTLALFLSINMAGLLTIPDLKLEFFQKSQNLNWESRSFDLIILMFFLIGGAFASLRVLPLRKVDPDE